MDDLICGKDIDDEDLIVELDGDDMFSHKQVIKNMDRLYKKKPNLVIANSKHVRINGKIGNSKAVDIRTARYSPFVFSHLRSWKAHLWRSVDKRYFIDEDGEYFKTAADVAYSLPMLEIAGQDRYMHLGEVMAVYNNENPRGDSKQGREGGFKEQFLASARMRMMNFDANPYFDEDKIRVCVKRLIKKAT